MRLVCPNCEAKYEVPEDAIPDTGRDVQCANCGHAWFQMRPRPPSASSEPAPAATAVPAPAAEETAEPAVEPTPPEVAADTAPADETAVSPEAAGSVDPQQPVADPEPAQEQDSPAAATGPEPEAATEPAAVADASEPQPEEAAAPPATAEEAPTEDAPDPQPAAAPAPAAAYAVDESVLAILREEAEREAQARAAEARAAEARALETQPDLGIDAALPDRKPALAAVAAAAPPAADADIEGELKPSARRDLLPDVEEINSTLRPSETVEESSATDGTAETRSGRSAFRSGFLTVMVVSILGAVVYIAAPAISRMVPASAEPLTAYVGAVDGLRLSLDGLMQSATVAINGE